MTENRLFDSATALSKVGRRIQTLVAFSGVPRGTFGQVIQADPGEGGYSLAIQWVLAGREGKPLVDWFSRAEYERFLREDLSPHDRVQSHFLFGSLASAHASWYIPRRHGEIAPAYSHPGSPARDPARGSGPRHPGRRHRVPGLWPSPPPIDKHPPGRPPG